MKDFDQQQLNDLVFLALYQLQKKANFLVSPENLKYNPNDAPKNYVEILYEYVDTIKKYGVE